MLTIYMKTKQNKLLDTSKASYIIQLMCLIYGALENFQQNRYLKKKYYNVFFQGKLYKHQKLCLFFKISLHCLIKGSEKLSV